MLNVKITATLILNITNRTFYHMLNKKNLIFGNCINLAHDSKKIAKSYWAIRIHMNLATYSVLKVETFK